MNNKQNARSPKALPAVMAGNTVPCNKRVKHPSSSTLRRLLVSKKKSVAKGPPPTSTTLMLQSLLDGENGGANKRQQKKIGRKEKTLNNSLPQKTIRSSQKKSACVQSTSCSIRTTTKNDSVWARVVSSSSNGDCDRYSQKQQQRGEFYRRKREISVSASAKLSSHSSTMHSQTLDDILGFELEEETKCQSRSVAIQEAKNDGKLEDHTREESTCVANFIPLKEKKRKNATVMSADRITLDTDPLVDGKNHGNRGFITPQDDNGSKNSSNSHDNGNCHDYKSKDVEKSLPKTNQTKTTSSLFILRNDKRKRDRSTFSGLVSFKGTVNNNEATKKSYDSVSTVTSNPVSIDDIHSLAKKDTVKKTNIVLSVKDVENKDCDLDAEERIGKHVKIIPQQLRTNMDANSMTFKRINDPPKTFEQSDSYYTRKGSSSTGMGNDNRQKVQTQTILTETATDIIQGTQSKKQKTAKSKGPSNNDNYVRLNLRNNAGACRGARNLKRHNRQKRWSAAHRQRQDQNHRRTEDLNAVKYEQNHQALMQGPPLTVREDSASDDDKRLKRGTTNIHTAIDPLDDFLDGVFQVRSQHQSSMDVKNRKGNVISSQERINSDSITSCNSKPTCSRHQRLCKLLVVKKTSTGNKGKKFYVCSMPRGEQCDFFQWEEDTVEAAQKALLQSSSHSGFIARQVAAYGNRFKMLTVPELRLEAKRRNVNASGKKNVIVTRLLIWVRDEISRFVISKDIEDSEESILDAISLSNINPIVGDQSPKEIEVDTKLTRKEDSLESGYVENSELCESDDESACSDDSGSTSSVELEICGLTTNSISIDTEPSDKGRSFEKPLSALQSSLQNLFGHSSFRNSQEWAIRRCLGRQHSLLVAPTGMGKSLCYALPAALMEGVCIVVSPLISLMEDQLRHLPPRIPAATLSGNLSTVQMATVVNDLLRNRLKIIFVSPERLASAAFRRLLRHKYNPERKSYERQLPPISLLCIDEAHCLSQWGHNFRPSYLRLRSLLPILEPRSVLALTATAGPPVIRDICHTLQIPMTKENTNSVDQMKKTNIKLSDDFEANNLQNGIKIMNCNRDNIDVAVAIVNNEEERLSMLFDLLKVKSNAKDTDAQIDVQEKKLLPQGCLSSGSVIVYVWRQKDAEIISEQLRGRDLHGGVVCYHGGMDASARASAQGQFMRGKARVCVATVAFGLGINKLDISGVIHMCLPSSPEHYMQEIGRAGRDGRRSRAIALIVADEMHQKHSLAHSGMVAKAQIRTLLLMMQKLVEEALSDISTSENNYVEDLMHLDLSLPIISAVNGIDCKEESIQTMISHLEVDSGSSPHLLTIEGIIPDLATVTLKRQPIDKLALKEPVMRCIKMCGKSLDGNQSNPHNNEQNKVNHNVEKHGGTASQKGFVAYSLGIMEFSVVRCARLLGPDAEPRHVYAALRRLQKCGEVELTFSQEVGRSFHLRLTKNGIRLLGHPSEKESGGDESSDNFIDRTTNYITNIFSKQVETCAMKVEKMYEIILRLSSVEKEEESSTSSSPANIYSGVNTSDKWKLRNENGLKSKRLVIFQHMINQYFSETSLNIFQQCLFEEGKKTSKSKCLVPNIDCTNSSLLAELLTDITSLLGDPNLSKNNHDPLTVQFGVEDSKFVQYTALAISKILHGIESPRCLTTHWFLNPLWGKWKNQNFSSVFDTVYSIIMDSYN